MSTPSKTFKTVYEAYQFLQKLGATPKLLRHVKLVGEVAELLISKLYELHIQFDEDFLRLGVAFHDAGKILHPKELIAKGNSHEADGETLLITHGVEPKLARCCRSHGQWETMACSFEEICVALADTLWKGKRNPQLENLLIQLLVARCHQEYWQLFIEMDSCFEAIASEGDARLRRSETGS